jgi:predicted MPP superfamily phosphohydrolase
MPRERPPIAGPASAPPSARRAALATALLAIWTLLLGGYAWLGEPGWLEVTHHVVGAPVAGRRPLRIVQVADLHLHGIGALERRVAAAVRAERPGLLVLGGDLVERPEDLPYVDDFLALLGDPPRTVAVLGNWERWSGVDLDALRATLARRNGTLLVNESLRLEHEGRTVGVLGLDDPTTGRADPARSAAGLAGTVDAVAIAHAPVVRDGWNGPPASFLLASHTHGGQVAFLGFAPALPAGCGSYLAGWYRGPPIDLYVSRGVGTSLLPVRFGARPEVAVFDWWPRSG